ncbi:MAG: hypothetical protein HRU25_13485 [Psychrobium sp.]|nr:hypothetical protein [Psychrobium sp.]
MKNHLKEKSFEEIKQEIGNCTYPIMFDIELMANDHQLALNLYYWAYNACVKLELISDTFEGQIVDSIDPEKLVSLEHQNISSILERGEGKTLNDDEYFLYLRADYLTKDYTDLVSGKYCFYDNFLEWKLNKDSNRLHLDFVEYSHEFENALKDEMLDVDENRFGSHEYRDLADYNYEQSISLRPVMWVRYNQVQVMLWYLFFLVEYQHDEKLLSEIERFKRPDDERLEYFNLPDKPDDVAKAMVDYGNELSNSKGKIVPALSLWRYMIANNPNSYFYDYDSNLKMIINSSASEAREKISQRNFKRRFMRYAKRTTNYDQSDQYKPIS